MNIRIAIGFFLFLLINSCGSSKNTVKQRKDKGNIQVEPLPEKLPSVNQKELTRKLEKKNKNLNKNTIAYIRKYAPIAVREMHLHKIPASITLAQGVLESGSGKSELALKSNNHFGIKCHTGWTGQRVYHDDDEKGECFRKYQYVATSYHDHSEFLTKRRRYAFLFNYSSKDYKRWARGLKKAGYATDPKYPKKLIGIIERYHLYEFDKIKKKDFKVEKIAKKPTKKAKNSPAKYYTVKKGDTLYSLSRKFGISVVKLKTLNRLKNNTISINQKLIVQ